MASSPFSSRPSRTKHEPSSLGPLSRLAPWVTRLGQAGQLGGGLTLGSRSSLHDTRGHQEVGIVKQNLDHVGVTSLGHRDQHGRVVLELVVGVGALLQENLGHIEVAAGAGEAEGRVIVIGCPLVDICADWLMMNCTVNR